MKNRQLIIIGTALLILVAGYGGNKFLAGMKEVPEKKKAEKSYRLVKVLEVENDTLVKRIPVNGKLIAAEKIEVFSEVSGVLMKDTKPFKVGQHFDKGEVLLAIDGMENSLNLKSQRSAFRNLITLVLPDIKIDYSDSFDTWKKYLSSIDASKPLPELPEVKDAQLKNLLSAKGIYERFFAIRSAENRQSKFTIVAPFSGSISAGTVNPGTLIRSGQKVGEFIHEGSYELEMAIAAEDAASISIGTVIKLSDRTEGKVIRMAKNADPGTQRVSLYASVKGDNLQEGVYMEGVLEVAKIPNTISINRNLVSEESTVFIVRDSVLAKKDVEVVHSFEQNSMVKGLSNGDLLLNQVIQGAYEGMLVKKESK